MKQSVLATSTAGILSLGTVFYHFVEGWGWVDSLYFCVVTLATIGYGDFSPETTLGRVFTIFYVLIGIGVFVSLVTEIATRSVERRKKRVEKRSHHPAEDTR